MNEKKEKATRVWWFDRFDQLRTGTYYKDMYTKRYGILLAADSRLISADDVEPPVNTVVSFTSESKTEAIKQHIVGLHDYTKIIDKIIKKYEQKIQDERDKKIAIGKQIKKWKRILDDE